MRKKTRALSGASQEAFFRRALKAHPGLSPAERDALLRKLRSEVAQVRVRVEPRAEAELPEVIGKVAEPPRPPTEAARVVEDPPAPTATVPFDPYSPNVVVVVRKEGRMAALAALDAIDSIDNLRLLAREQRLSIGEEPVTAADVRMAIVTAAERRIANRMAAAS
jgi:hypothetical protein